MRYRMFLTLYLGFFISLIIIAALLLLYLSLLFEHNSYEAIAKRQIKNNSLYGSALNENFFSYRLKMTELQKPDILAIGSSRVGQFKAKYFKHSFYTAANSANDIFQMQKFIDKTLKIYTPKVVILGLDPWWFHPQYFPTIPAKIASGNSINASKIKTAYQYLFEHKIPFSLDFFTSSSIPTPYIQNDALGIRAIKEGYGSFVDGSYFFGSLIYGFKKNLDLKFSQTLKKIQSNHARFIYGQEIDIEAITTLNQIFSILQGKNITIYVFLTPVAHRIAQAMLEEHKEHYIYLFKLFTYLEELKIANFFNPNALPHSSDCEFYDGFHGGDITYARILLELAKKQPSFANYLNLEVIQNTIQNKSGYAYSGEHFGNLKELDFLQIGCKK